MPARKGEIDAIEKLLLSEHEDSQALAKAIIEMLDQHRASRVDWCVIVWQGPLVRVYGPWPGRASAAKALADGKVPLVGAEKAVVSRYIGTARMSEQMTRYDTPPDPEDRIQRVTGRALRPQTDPFMENITEIHVLDRERQTWRQVYAESSRGKG